VVSIEDTTRSINVFPVSDVDPEWADLFPLGLTVRNVGGRTARNCRVLLQYPNGLRLTYADADTQLPSSAVASDTNMGLLTELHPGDVHPRANLFPQTMWASVPNNWVHGIVDTVGGMMLVAEGLTYPLKVTVAADDVEEFSVTLVLRVASGGYFERRKMDYRRVELLGNGNYQFRMFWRGQHRGDLIGKPYHQRAPLMQ
jgi:hypothetical protein